MQRKDRSTSNVGALVQVITTTCDIDTSRASSVYVSVEKLSDATVKSEVSGTPLAPPKSMGGKPALSDMKPSKVSYTYEAYYASLTQESELNRFKCRAPGCNKVFRKEAVLRQHHKHYHQQRYKLRDQEITPAQKRKAAREEAVNAKRRVSADYYASSVQSPKISEASISPTTPAGGVPRTRGGKPPLDVYRMQQGADALVTSSTNDDVSIGEVKSQSSATVDDKKGESPSSDKTATTQQRKRRVRSGSGTSRHSSEAAVDAKDFASDAKEAKRHQRASSDSALKNLEIVNEDVIRCVCGSEEEEGFMMQCDACLTWQHAKCEGIGSPARDGAGKEQKTPTDYICKVCRKPPGVRKSAKYLYNNDYLIKGKLPDFSSPLDDASTAAEAKRELHFQQIMQATHQLMEELNKMQESLHGIRLKLDISNPAKNHSLLYLWKETHLGDKNLNSTFTKKDQCPKVEDQSKSIDSSSGPMDVGEEAPSQPTNTTKEAKLRDHRSLSDDNSSVHKLLQSMVKETVKAVSPSCVGSDSPNNSSGDVGDEKDVDVTDHHPVPNALTGGKTKKEDVIQVFDKHSEDMMETDDHMKEKCNESCPSDQMRSTRSRDQTNSIASSSAKSNQSESPVTMESSEAKQSNTDEDDDIWKPIQIITDGKPVPHHPSRRSRSKSDDLQEGVVIRCRGNLLQHIHHLEDCLSERLVQLGDYVSNIEKSFDCFVRASPTSSGGSLPSYDDRLGELQSDLGSLHHDIDAMQKLFSSPSVASS